MLARLLLLFIAVPLIELAILLKLGSVFGLLPTIALVIVTGVAGASLARSQGLRVLLQIRQELAAGQVPVGKLMDGLIILIAGALLLTPGLLTDLVGLTVLLPGPRDFVKRQLGRRLSALVSSGRFNVTVITDSGQM